MDTVLDSIDTYIRDNGIPFKDIWVSRSIFPSQFNKIIEDEMYKLNPKSKIDKDYCITYDNNGNLVLLAQAFKTRILLADKVKDVEVDYPCTKMHFERIFDKSSIYKYNLNEYNRFKEIIKSNSPSIDDETVETITSELIDVLNNKLSRELMKTNEEIYDRDPSLMIDYFHTISLITGYIEYLNNEYKSQINTDVIVYNPNIESDNVKFRTGIIDNKKVNKKYSVISASDRMKILESHPYMYMCCSREFEKDDIDNLCYLYSLNDNNYEIIIEPYNGEGLTRVIQLYKEDEFTFEDFKEYCIKYLEYSLSETRKSKNIAKLYHTTYDKYKTSIDYAITRDENVPIHPYTKNNIDSLVDERKEVQIR